MTPSLETTTSSASNALSLEQLLKMHRYMVLIREWDKRALKLQRSGRISFCVTSQGEEATQIATAAALEPTDWIFPSYRQYGMAMWRGASLEAMAHQLYGTAKDRVKGRQMPCHYSFSDLRYVSVSSVIGTQIIQGVGAAVGAQIRGERVISTTYMGDGATSANDFHAGMNMAGVYKAPVIFVCVNNQYAISTPLQKQTASDTIADKAKAYGFPGIRVDGNDAVAVYHAMREAANRARNGEGPTLLELLTYRVDPHSSSDDPTRYREASEQAAWLQMDPIDRLADTLRQDYNISKEQLAAHWQEAQEAVQAATQIAEKTPKPDLTTLFDDVYAEVPPSLATQRDACLQLDGERKLPHAGAFPL